MERKLRRCCVCLNEYKFCPKCEEDFNKPNWYFTYCSENCKDIYNVTSNFEDGNISDKNAKEKLEKLDLSRLEYFGISYKNSISKIMSYVEPAAVVKDIVEIQKVDIEENSDIKTTDYTTETGTENDNKIEEKVLKKPRNRKAKNVE